MLSFFPEHISAFAFLLQIEDAKAGFVNGQGDD
jgi:hypothetical protein